MEIRVCDPVSKVFPTVAAALNGGTVPEAITIGEDTFFFVDATERMRKHEAKHREQKRRFEPWWIPNVGPLGDLRRAIGTSRFLENYFNEHRKYGYDRNHWEIEARAAEDLP